MRSASLVWLLLAGCAAARPPAEIVVRDSAPGEDGETPAADGTLEYRLVREGEFYVRGGVRVPAVLVDYLRRLAEEAPECLDGLPAELNVTPAAVEEHRNEILDAALAGQEQVPRDVPEELEGLFSLEAVRAVAVAEFVDPARDTSYSELSLTLPGDPPMVLSSESERPWLQPWRVTVGGRTRTVYSLEISKAVALLADPRGYNAQNLNGAQYWGQGFWRDGGVWSRAIGDKLVAHHAMGLCRDLEGYEEASRRFSVKSATIGDINMHPLSLYVKIEATGDELIDRVRWWDVLDGDVPGHDWHDFQGVYDACTNAAAKLPFLRAWKAKAAGRTLSLDIVGTTGYGEADMPTFVLPAWDDSGLKGSPDFELLLDAGKTSWAKIYFSPAGGGALLVDAGDVFPEVRGVRFHPQAPEYAVIDPDGAIRRRRLGKP